MHLLKNACFVGAAALAMAAFGYDADTMAMYLFMEAAPGAEVSLTAGSVTNAVDGALYAGQASTTTAYTWGNYGGAVYPGSPRVTYSDDVPGPYLYDGSVATEVMLEAGQYQSVVMPDALAGYSNATDKASVIYCPPLTNASARTVKTSYYGDTWRPWGASTVNFPGMDCVLAKETGWTIECFVKHGQMFTDGGTVIRLCNNSSQSYSKAYLMAGSGIWSRFNNSGNGYDLPGYANIHDLGWYHAALTYTNGTVTLYINHEAVSTRSVTPEAPATDDASYGLRIGDYRTNFPGTPFYGKVAALRITKRALAPSEMLYVTNARRTGNLTVTADYVVPAEGVSCQNLVIDGAARVTGGKITVEGNVFVNADATLANSEIELPNSGGVITVAAGRRLDLDAVLSGVGNFSVTGTGKAYFNAANTFTGVMTITGGVEFHAANDQAFGDPAAKTVVQSSGVYGDSQLWFDGVTVSEPFDTYFDPSVAKPRLCFTANTTNVLYGTVTGDGGRRTNFRFEAGSVSVFSNTWTNLGATDSSGNAASAEIHIWGSMVIYRTYFGGGHYYFHSRMPSNCLGENYGVKLSSNDTFIMCCRNVFCPSEDATAAYAGATLWFWGGGTLDLNGYDQRFSRLNSYNKTAMSGGTVTSAQPATLHFDNTVAGDADRLTATFERKAALSVEGPRPFSISSKNVSEGELTVMNGSQVTIDASGEWVGPVHVTGAGSVLTLASANAFGTAGELSVSDGGTVAFNLNGAAAVISKISVNGAEFTEPGYYGPVGSGADHEFAALTGNGTLMIPASAAGTFTWNAEGANDALATADNWEGGVAPNLADGQDTAIFATAGEQATVAADAKLLGATFNRSFTLAAGGGTLSVGTAGVKVETVDHADRVITNAAPLRLAGAQEWMLTGSNTTWRQQGAISGEAYAPITLDGDGRIYLDGDNSGYHGQVTLAGGYNGTRGLDVYPGGGNAFGSGKVVMNTAQSSRAMIRFGAGRQVYGNDFEITTSDRGNSGEMEFFADSDVTFLGKVKISTYNRSVYGQRSRVVYAGGFESSGTRSSFGDMVTMVITNVPAKMTHLWSSGYESKVEVWTSNNTWTDSAYGIGLEADITLDLHAPYAVCTSAVNEASMGYLSPRFVYWHGSSLNRRPTIRLNGFNQTISYIGLKYNSAESTAGTPCVVTSTVPAQLEVHQNVSSTVKMLSFAGTAGLTLYGTGTLTMLNVPSPTTGRLEVAGGHLALSAPWPNVSEVVVSAGSLALGAGDLFGKRVTDLKLATGATLDLSADQMVHDLYVDGVKLPQRKTYTKDSPELSGIVTGNGTIFVYGDGPGTKIFLR